jgi:hypothetical protein
MLFFNYGHMANVPEEKLQGDEKKLLIFSYMLGFIAEMQAQQGIEEGIKNNTTLRFEHGFGENVDEKEQKETEI